MHRRFTIRTVNWEVFITCAVTGAGDTAGRSEHVPVTPEQIADAAIEAARAGAAIAHIHVRDPETGKGARDPALYREVVERIRAADVDVVLNLTAGMGGDLVLGGDEAPLPPDEAGTDMAGAAERLAHVEELLPEICTLDCGTMNFAAGGDYVMVNTPGDAARDGARGCASSACARSSRCSTPATSCFVHELIRDGLIDDPPMIQLCTGIPYGAPDDLGDAARDGQPPAGERDLLGVLDRPDAAAVRRARRARRRQRARRARGQPLPLARAARRRTRELVERAVAILESMNVRVLGPEEVRAKLALRVRV